MTLREQILQEIRERGPIPFSRYMDMCLYHPELGYYSQNLERFGTAGDFYTSSDVHAVYGRLLARLFEEMWQVLGALPQIDILELGPGRGLFARDVMDWSEEKFPEFFKALRYTLVERSPALRQRLGKTLERSLVNGKASLSQSLHPPLAATLASSIPLIVFANEFFDALPVEVLSAEGQLHIAEENGSFLETWTTPSDEVLEFMDRYGVHPEPGERVEARPAAQALMSQIAATIQRGFVIVVDYGYTRAEQLAGRHRDTLMTYRQHSAGTNPYEAPGEQDITAHVNFTALAAAAEQQGMQAQPLRTQCQFLMGIGEKTQFADAFADCRLPQERAKVALQLKHLVTPVGMGESFQVLVASRGVDPKAVRLSGLSFALSQSRL